MSRLHWLGLLVLLAALLLLSKVAESQELQMSWNRVDTDILGGTINAPVEYRVYSMIEGIDSDFVFRGQVEDTVLVVPLNAPACFSVYVTAVRMDDNKESAPSNIASDCFYADNEPDPVVEPDPDPVIEPELKYPPESTLLEMRIDD